LNGSEHFLPPDSFEVVVKGRLSDALIRGTGTELVNCEGGLSRLIAPGFDQLRLHTLFELFQDLNIELVSVNSLSNDLIASFDI
jgi:hypothetical protein